MTSPTTAAKDIHSGEILTSQWLDRMSSGVSDVPERRLLLAILADAVHCLQLEGKPRVEVFAWVRGQDASVRISFQLLCDGLGMEVAPLARRLLRVAAGDIQLIRGRRPPVRSHGTLPIVEVTDNDTPRS